LWMSPLEMVDALGQLIQKVAGQQRDLAKAEKKAAREERIACEQREVAEMRDKAGSILNGAIASSVCAIGSGSLGIASAAIDTKVANPALEGAVSKADNAKLSNLMQGGSSSGGFDWKGGLSASSRGLSDLSRPLGQWFGDAPAAMHEASVKAAEFASKRAEDRVSDANDSLQEYQSLAQEAQETIKACRRANDDVIQSILRRM